MNMPNKNYFKGTTPPLFKNGKYIVDNNSKTIGKEHSEETIYDREKLPNN